MQSNTSLPETGYLRIAQVLRLYPVSRSTWWAGCKSGIFPKPIKIGVRCTAWRVEDVRELIERSADANSQCGAK